MSYRQTRVVFCELGRAVKAALLAGISGIATSSSFRADGSNIVFADRKARVGASTGGAIAHAVMRVLSLKPARRAPRLYVKAPQLVVPGIYRNMVHLDISRAYASIYRFLCFDVEASYSGNVMSFGLVGMHPTGALYEMLPDSKVALSAPAGIALSHRKTRIENHRASTFEYANRFYNPLFVSLINCVLLEIAREAERMGCVYWATDGGILPESAAEEFAAFCSNLGLRIAKKGQGIAMVTAPGVYRIGGKHTLKYARRVIQMPLPAMRTNALQLFLEAQRNPPFHVNYQPVIPGLEDYTW